MALVHGAGGRGGGGGAGPAGSGRLNRRR
jgi:hypothetical protein